jgi:hypothetical protein
MAGTLEISRPNINEARQTAAMVKTSFCDGENGIVIFQIKLMGTGKTALNTFKGETQSLRQCHLAQVQVNERILEVIKE